MINPTLERKLHSHLEYLKPEAPQKVLGFAQALANGTLADEQAQEKIDALRKIAAR